MSWRLLNRCRNNKYDLIDYLYVYFKKLSNNNKIGSINNYYENSFKNLLKFISNFNKKNDYYYSNLTDILFNNKVYNKTIFKFKLNYLVEIDYCKIDKIYKDIFEYLKQIKDIILFKDKLHVKNNILK